ncbi:MAG TPA: nuclear transport factor 2 family protein [Candidatus Polarisedimenticolaceae bacterium]|nr:nuclear transport factor 2 family protein [Candidatus Polarisedimenticolaceae bacterium]
MIATVLLAAACEATPAAVRHVAEGIIAADNHGDLERVLSSYTKDAVLMPPGEGAIVGLDAIRPRYEKLFAGATLQIELRVDEAHAEGAVGYVRGRNGGRVTPKAGGQPLVLDDAFLMLLRCDAGTWRISHIIWHPASLPTP